MSVGVAADHELEGYFEPVSFQGGDTIFTAGDPSDFLIVLAVGVITLHLPGAKKPGGMRRGKPSNLQLNLMLSGTDDNSSSISQPLPGAPVHLGARYTLCS